MSQDKSKYREEAERLLGGKEPIRSSGEQLYKSCGYNEMPDKAIEVLAKVLEEKDKEPRPMSKDEYIEWLKSEKKRLEYKALKARLFDQTQIERINELKQEIVKLEAIADCEGCRKKDKEIELWKSRAEGMSDYADDLQAQLTETNELCEARLKNIIILKKQLVEIKEATDKHPYSRKAKDVEILELKKQLTEKDEYYKDVVDVIDWYGTLIKRESIGTAETSSLKAYIEKLEAQLTQAQGKVVSVEEINALCILPHDTFRTEPENNQYVAWAEYGEYRGWFKKTSTAIHNFIYGHQAQGKKEKQ